MIRHPKYVYGEGNMMVPLHLNFGRYMVETLAQFKDKVALINGSTGEHLTYKKIVDDTMHLSISLRDLGIGKGDTVAICSENRHEYWATVLGIACAGATISTVNVMYKKDELKHVLGISKPKTIFCSPLTYETHEETLRSLSYLERIVIYGNNKVPNTLMYEELVAINKEHSVTVENFAAVDVQGQTDTLFILYSSGTSGPPKGVILTHLNALSVCVSTSFLDPAKSTLLITPWYHALGLMFTLNNFLFGNTTIHLPKFDPDLYLKTVEKYKIPQLLVVPAVLIAISKVQTGYDVSCVETIGSSAAPLKDDTIQVVKKRFPKLEALIQGYGMTETTFYVISDTYQTAYLAKSGGVGFIGKSNIIKIEDIQTRKALGPNEPGEICIKGPSVMKGYVGIDKREVFDDEGFFRTGDIGYYDDSKYFFIVDRLKELIKYKGYQVPPAEIEGILLQHPEICDAGVIGIPDPVGGEVPQAFVVLQPGKNLSEEEIQNYIKEKLSNPKHLRGGVRFVEKIPKNPSGKILRRKLREMSINKS